MLTNRLILLLVLAVVSPTAFAQDNKFDDDSRQRDVLGGDLIYVPKSTQKICQVTGDLDRENNPPAFVYPPGTPTASQTGTRFGLFGADLGYSFEHNGRLFFLFGDAMPTLTFNGQANGVPPRSSADDDAIGYVWNSNITDPCPALDLVASPNGAFQSPVVLNDRGQPAITLRIDEFPDAGISVGGRMYVIFATDNSVYLQGGVPVAGNLGFPTRTVIGVSDDDAKTFHYLYDFSKPATPGADGAKFIYVAIARGQDDYLYFWGSAGGTQFRQSVPISPARELGSWRFPERWNTSRGLMAMDGRCFRLPRPMLSRFSRTTTAPASCPQTAWLKREWSGTLTSIAG